ncbi:MAG: GDSL-type esterase/lipase family protein [Pseudomonadota bacterium]|nr:GDSL-type esterase/lipase family protein [Pseudomonadota bacterium]
MLFGTVVALVVVELGMRLAGLGNPVDGTDVIQSYEPANVFEVDEDRGIGIRMRPGYAGKQVYRRATDGVIVHEAVTNVSPAGFRSESTRTFGKVILAVGDSTTFGVGVDDGESWPAALERTLSTSWRVLNAGTPGRNTSQETSWLRAHGAETNPAVVILAFYINDLMPPIPLSGDVQPNRMKAPPWASREAGLRRASRIYNLGWRTWERRALAAPAAGGGSSYEAELVKMARKEDLRAQFDHLMHACARLRAQPVLVLLPALDLSDPRVGAPVFVRAREAASAASLPFIDAEHALDDFDLPDRRVLPGEHHASVRANARIADVIREGLVAKGIL